MDDWADADETKPEGRQPKKLSSAPTTPAELFDIAKLRSRIAQLELEVRKWLDVHFRDHKPAFQLSTAKCDLSAAENARTKTSEELEDLKEQLNKARQEHDKVSIRLLSSTKECPCLQISSEKDEVWAQMVRVTKMLDEANTKLQEREHQVEKARQATESAENELRQVFRCHKLSLKRYLYRCAKRRRD